MKTKAFLILASVLLASVSTSLSAAEKITGAFGVKLGQILSSQMIETSELAFTDQSDYTYSFSPDKKFRSFSTYLIQITPKTRKIYSISAEGDMGYTSCKKELAVITAVIKKKYKKGGSSSRQVIRQGNRSITTRCSGWLNPTLHINYLDSKLEELAENERIAVESSKIDSSVL